MSFGDLPRRGVTCAEQAEKEVTMRIAPRITDDKAVRFGRPVIEGTRVPVDLVLGQLAGGMTIETVMEEYALSREDVLAALAYAASHIAGEDVRATG